MTEGSASFSASGGCFVWAWYFTGRDRCHEKSTKLDGTSALAAASGRRLTGWDRILEYGGNTSPRPFAEATVDSPRNITADETGLRSRDSSFFSAANELA